jgi:3-oxoadipate enol-lactonase
MRMAIISTHGAALGVEATDTGKGPPILFLHGVGSDKSVWRRQLQYFDGRRVAISIDYPGYGESAVQERATRDDYARAAWNALDALGIGRAHVCGLSLGGVVAIAMHALAPERCCSLILADTFAVHPDGQGIYDRSLAGSSNMRAFAEARVDFLLAQPANPEVRAEVIETMARINPAAYRLGAQAVWLADQRDRVRNIAVPTLVICGEEDRPTPPDLSRELHAMIAGSRFELIAHAGHLINIERPAEFNRLVEAFVAAAD